MKRKNNFFAFLLSFVLLFCSAIGLSACSTNKSVIKSQSYDQTSQMIHDKANVWLPKFTDLNSKYYLENQKEMFYISGDDFTYDTFQSFLKYFDNLSGWGKSATIQDREYLTYLSMPDSDYPVYFGMAFSVNNSSAMSGGLSEVREDDTFCFRLLNENEKKELSSGTEGVRDGDIVVCWYDDISSKRQLCLTRIDAVRTEGNEVYYSTRGDNRLTYDKDQQGNQIWRKAEEIQGILVGKVFIYTNTITKISITLVYDDSEEHSGVYINLFTND